MYKYVFFNTRNDYSGAITPGKLYKVKLDCAEAGYTTTDEGNEIYILFKGCAFLDGGDWVVLDEDISSIYFTKSNYEGLKVMKEYKTYGFREKGGCITADFKDEDDWGILAVLPINGKLSTLGEVKIGKPPTKQTTESGGIMKLEDIKSGMRVHILDKEGTLHKFVVIAKPSGNLVAVDGVQHWANLQDYDGGELTNFKTGSKIVNVFSPPDSIALYSNPKHNGLLIWERKEEEVVEELTVAEIEAKLGYKVKVVK